MVDVDRTLFLVKDTSAVIYWYLQEYVVDGVILSTVWGISAVVGGTMQNQISEISKINAIISNGANNIALAKAVQGSAYIGDAPGENMIDVGRWQYKNLFGK